MAIKKIIKLSTNWCPPCKAFSPTFHKVSEMEEYKDIEFNEIDIEEDEDGETLAAKYQVRSVPTTLFLDEKDEIIYKLMGNVPLKDFIQLIETNQKEN